MNAPDAYTPQHAWKVAYSQLELQLDRGNFDTWLRGASLLRVEGGGVAAGQPRRATTATAHAQDDEPGPAAGAVTTFVVGVRSAYARDMLQHRLYRNVARVLSDVWGAPLELRFEVHQPPAPVARDDLNEMPLFRLLAEQQRAAAAPQDQAARGGSASPDERAGTAEDGPATLSDRVRRAERQTLPEHTLNPKFTFERYVVSNANRLAHEAARAVSEHPGRYYNPFFVYGGVGQGKTHMLHAIGHACAARGLRVLYISSEAFMNEMIESIRHKTTPMFRERYRGADVLLVDDVQFIAGKESTQEEFFHTFNALYTFNKQIVLASDRPPHLLDTLEDRLRSRFEGGLVVDIPPLEFETRLAIMRMWAEERGVRPAHAVLELVAERVCGNVRELEGAFNQVIAATQFAHQPLTLAGAEGVLQRYEAPRQHQARRALTLDQVFTATATFYCVPLAEMLGKGRAQRVNTARQVAMLLARELTDASLAQIGVALGGRSHTTVMHGCNKVVEQVEQDGLLAGQIDALRAQLRIG